MNTRPAFHQWDATIEEHMFCSFLALVLVDEMKRHLAGQGWQVEWKELCQDMEALEEEVGCEKSRTYCATAKLTLILLGKPESSQFLYIVGIGPADARLFHERDI